MALIGARVDDAPVRLVGTPRAARLPRLPPGRRRVEVQAAALHFGGEARVEWREPGGAWAAAPGGVVRLSRVGAGEHAVELRAVVPGGGGPG